MKRPDMIAKQSSKPSGLIGWLIGNIMAKETVGENTIALDYLDLKSSDRLLEIGFGHGRTVQTAAGLLPSGFVAGVDRSQTMVNSATRRNKKLIRAGNVELKLGEASHLPFADATFDKVLTVHTIYFWTNPGEQLREIRRVLKPQGRFVLCFRYDQAAIEAFPASVYTFRAPDQVAELFRVAGFADIKIETRQVGVKTVFWAIARKSG